MFKYGVFGSFPAYGSDLHDFLFLVQLVGCRVLPWAKANLNYTAQALIISAGTVLLKTSCSANVAG
jgi:hypothetical protein